MILLIISLIGLSICASASLLASRHTIKDRKIPGYRLLVDVYITHSIYYITVAGLIINRMLSDQPYEVTPARAISAIVVLIPAVALARFALFLSGKIDG